MPPQLGAVTRVPVILKLIAFTIGAFMIGAIILTLAAVAGSAVMIFVKSSAQMPWLAPTVVHLVTLVLSLGAMTVFGSVWRPLFGMALPVRSTARWPYVAALIVGTFSALAVRLIGGDFDPVPDYTVWQVIVLVWAFASVCEEILCRGLLQGLFAQAWTWAGAVPREDRRAPIFLSALFFMFMHLPLIGLGATWSVMAFLLPSAFILSWLAGTARQRTGSVLPAVYIHAVFNVCGALVDWMM